MEISEDKYFKLLEALVSKGFTNTCKECNHRPMVPFKKEFQLSSFERMGKQMDASNVISQQVLNITCPNCGAVKLFSIKVLLPDYE